MEQREIEEILELIWTMREEGISSKKMLLEITNEKQPKKLLSVMQKNKLISQENDSLYLTQAGEKYAEAIIRRHRLAERLFKDVFKNPEVLRLADKPIYDRLMTVYNK